jgi:hypothetical protein
MLLVPSPTPDKAFIRDNKKDMAICFLSPVRGVTVVFLENFAVPSICVLLHSRTLDFRGYLRR